MYGRMLADGRCVVPDLPMARVGLRNASDAGMAEAQVALTEMMINGRGGLREAEAALALFEAGADQGHSGAMFALGALHAGGHDLPDDRAAAELGHGPAPLMLGRYLAGGVTGQPEARAWLERVAAQGIAEAQDDLATLPSPVAQ